MSKILEVEINSKGREAYNIVIEPDFNKLPELIVNIFSSCNKFMLVFDSNTEKYFKEKILQILNRVDRKIHTFSFAAGEDSKNMLTVQKLYEELIKHSFERNDVILAVGGGVVGDLAGFVSATYLRGIRFAGIPTTLLAMSDSSVGGKTGVDFMGYKNMVGAFHQPKLVYMNTESLSTLPEREYLSGMAEVIKYGYIWDSRFLAYLSENADKIISKNREALEYIIFHSCRIKKEVVENDPLEKGLRAILNFGHTIGHAIEKLMEFKLLHGECVAVGMIAAGKIAVYHGLMSEDELFKMKEILIKYRLFRRIRASEVSFNENDVLFATKSDKKMQGGKIKFILTAEIGRAEVYKDITDEEILYGIKEVFEG
ncbi:MAG: 3-dehydroquinate synthase [Peptoanaerobacter stomatis]|uniref:3-dehydroquinate synthase n=1 Tax=Peptoanaerobacter stomatis TaxID=796937 RepID=UPI003F9FD7FA